MARKRKTLTDNQVAAIKPGTKRITLPDPEMSGHYVRVTPAGAKSYCAVARNPSGKQIWATIGNTDHWKIDEAREQARGAIKRIKAGLSPFEAPPAEPETFKAVAEDYMKRHVEENKLRSKAEIQRLLDNDIYPAWKNVPFTEIRRSDVTKLLDAVQDRSGAQQADHVLACVRGIMNWYATRTDDYVPPLARGMRRTDPRKRARERILNDDELRLVWKVAEENGRFGAIARLLLVTAQRREKVAAMRWADVSIDGVWTIPTEEREKGHAGALVLPETALAIIRAQPKVGDSEWIFPARTGEGHVTGWSPLKRYFDEKILKMQREAALEAGDDPDTVTPLADWRLHDLRRTARSLMSRAGVRPDIAERVMGHAIQGVEGIYDRHAYRQEKADALAKLAVLIERIVNPPAANVVPIAAAEA